MRHSKQAVELEFNPNLPKSKSHFVSHALELVGRGGGRGMEHILSGEDGEMFGKERWTVDGREYKVVLETAEVADSCWR